MEEASKKEPFRCGGEARKDSRKWSQCELMMKLAGGLACPLRRRRAGIVERIDSGF